MFAFRQISAIFPHIPVNLKPSRSFNTGVKKADLKRLELWMTKTQITDMVCVMNTMLDNMAKLLEEMRSLQKDIENRLNQAKEEPEEKGRNLKQEKQLHKTRASVAAK